MNCPNCRNNTLNNKRIEEELSAEACEKCGGYWVSSQNYDRWLESHGGVLPEIPGSDDAETSIPQFQPARLCPRDKRIMIKYRIGRNIPFSVDRCGECGGVWFDRNEWETLKSRNLHDELGKIFTDQWQEEIDRDERRKTFDRIFREKFGAGDYEKIKDIKSWIDGHEKRSEILAYLDDPNPLQF